jgi:hypothetical protein
METITVQLNLAEENIVTQLSLLESALEKEPLFFNLQLIGPAVMASDKALLLYDALMQRSPRTRLITYARSCLLDATVLLWLAGDERKIRETAWIQMDSLERLLDTEPWKNPEVARRRSISKFVTEPAWVTDYRTAARLLNEYLPLEEVADRPIFRAELAELGLLATADEEIHLTKCFAKSAGILDAGLGA